ncbi:MAG: hypothetical protein JO225_11910, partial [Candidatus Eremiobacteraeota bacterium]|nr:hypothetical protein [Candidatus Eremiobacteraeota bacterium]
MNRETIVTTAVVALVAGGVGAGFWLTGSPSHARLVALDERRVHDLDDLSVQISFRYGKIGRPRVLTLPIMLSPSASQSRFGSPITDPVTGRPYEYHRDSPTSYRLCATFATAQNGTSPYGAARGH